MKIGWNRGIVDKAAVTVIVLVMLSSPGIIGQGQASTDVLILEYDNSIDISALPDIVSVIQDYGNGRALVELADGGEGLLAASGISTLPISDRTMVTPGAAGITFDWKEGEPAIEKELLAPANSDKYIVKFKGPVVAEWPEQITEIGGVVHADIAKYAVIAQLDESQKSQVENLPYVDWIGDYHPAYKIAPEIWQDVDNVPVEASIFDGADMNSVVKQLDEMGATINQVNPADNLIYFTIDRSMIGQVADIDSIYLMYYDGPKEWLDTNADILHGSVDAWYPDWSGLPVPLDGNGEIIGIQDSGFDIGSASSGHTDFFQGPDGDRIIRYTDRTGNSNPDGDQDGVAHGTAIAGLVAGNSWCWETWMGLPTNDYEWHEAEATGAVPRAELSIDGVEVRGGGISMSSAYWNDQYADGARTMTMTTGSTPADYGSTSATIDTQMDADDRMIISAAGGSGPDPDTIGPFSQAKNGISVGSNQNYRPEWFDSDNPNLIMDRSARGGTFSDGRIKPDLLAAGSSVLTPLGSGEVQYWIPDLQSNWYGPPPDEYNSGSGGPGSDGYSDYTYFSGTSASAAITAGAYAQVRQYLREIESIPAPPSELSKAILINGCEKMDESLYVYPGYDQGWGRVNVKNSLFPDAPTTWQYDTNTFTSTNPWTPAFTTDVYSSDAPLKVSLVWKDSSGLALNRDLDLRITSPSGDIYKGNSFTTSAPYWSMPNTDANRPDDNGMADGQDHDNNVEQVWVESPEVGTWTVEVLVSNQPSNISSAIVMSCDIGPQDSYEFLLETSESPGKRMVPGGSLAYEFSITNFGTLSDSISLTDDSPFTITYSPTGPYTLAPAESIDVIAIISDDAGSSPSEYDFAITGTSAGDPLVRDRLPVGVNVINIQLPFEYSVLPGIDDDMRPSVVTYTDLSSTSHILISYIKTSDHGKRIFVIHTTLDAVGRPVEPWGPEIELPAAGGSNYTEPNDARIVWMNGGLYRDRVFIAWNGAKTGATEETASTAWCSYADTTSGFDSQSDWQTTEIDQNGGANPINVKRLNSIIPIASQDEIIYLWEHLDYNTPDDANPIGVDTHCRMSNNGGNSWGALTQVTPGDGNYYFMPHGTRSHDYTSGRDVAWIYFYWRTPSGNDRDLRVRLYDGVAGWQSGSTDVWDTTDNIQFPYGFTDFRGSDCRNYVGVLRDQGTSSFTLWTTYIDGNFNAANPPPDSTNGWGNTHGPFGTQVSDANYNNGPVIPGIVTDDGYAWIAYREKSTPYSGHNLHTIYSNDGFGSTTTKKITTDSRAKGHQMVSSLTIGSYDNIYEVYHASDYEYSDVDYNIYLAIYDNGMGPDLQGPEVTEVYANPNPILSSDSTVDIFANLNEIPTGFSGIMAAEYWVSSLNPGAPVEPVWPNVGGMTLTGYNQTEIATATVSVPFGAVDGDYFYVWVHGQDSLFNWGPGNYVRVDVVGIAGFNDTIPIPDPGGPWPSWRFISFTRVINGDALTVFNDAVFGDSGTTWDMLQWYDPNDTLDHWKCYNKNFAGFQDMPAVNNSMGFWIHITGNGGDQALSTGAVGPMPGVTGIDLEAGWNLVGYPSSTPRLAQDTLPAEVTKVAEYDSFEPYLIAEDGLDILTMSEYNAYWVYATSATTWTVNP